MRSNTGWVLALVVALSAGALQGRSAAAEGAADRSATAADEQTAADQKTVVAFARLWARRLGIYPETRFLGIETLQNPTDAWVTQEIIQEVVPDVIVETGTYKGGSALYWAMLLRAINPNGRVITIDIEDNVDEARERALWKERVDFLLGSSTDPAIVEEVRRRAEGKRVLVILDSHHSPKHVHEELQRYAPLVAVGSYVIVQDTGLGSNRLALNLAAGGVRRFLAESDAFEVDEARERFMITNNPRGYLRRVR